MAKDWGDRWGSDTRFKHGSSKSGWYNKPEVKNPMYISDGTRAVKLTEALVSNIKTRLLLGMTSIKVPNQTMYYTAQIKPEECAVTIGIDGFRVCARAIKPFRGVWEFRVLPR